MVMHAEVPDDWAEHRGGSVAMDWFVEIDGVEVGPEWYADPATLPLRLLVAAVLDRQASELAMPTDLEALAYAQLGDEAVA